mmetsp:Transcript_12390/g.26890  ORF Transcript_12390/g.26890 Transcript_12390/m.26890 type:complete len:107 (-) Transcript_12390:396-716(-)
MSIVQKKYAATEAIPNTDDSPISHDSAATGGDDSSTNHSGSEHICVSKKRNFPAPVSIDKMTAGNNTPGHKNDAGSGVMVKSHAMAKATRLEIPEMYAMICEMCHA